MFLELQAAYFVLKRWNRDHAATRRKIGIWQDWKQQTADNDRPLTVVEVERMKALLRRNAPTSYFDIFRGRQT
jgi:hypothetical protein